MPKKSPKLALVTASQTRSPTLDDLTDQQRGPLSEAEALADTIHQLAVTVGTVREDTLVTLSTMLCARLDQVRGVVEDHLATTGGAA